MAGAAVSPALAAIARATPLRPGTSLADSTPQPGWSYTDQTMAAPPLLGNGVVLVPTWTTASDGSSASAIYGVDIHTSQRAALPAWSAASLYDNSPDGGISVQPLLAGSVLYYADTSGNVYAIDASPGAGANRTIWTASGDNGYFLASTELRVYGGMLLFVTQDAVFHALDPQTGAPLWSCTLAYTSDVGVSRVWPPVFVGDTVYVAVVASASPAIAIHAVSLTTRAQLWTYPIPLSFAGVPCVGDGTLYASIGAALYAVDITNPKAATGAWSLATTGAAGSANSLAYYGGVLYVAGGDDTGGSFRALDPLDRGATLWSVTSFPSALNGNGDPIVIEDGIAYVSDAGGTLYAIDLASKGADAVSYDPGAGPLDKLFVETGVCYYWSRARGLVGSVNLAGLVHEIFAESELMAADYQGTGGPIQPAGTSYVTHVAFFDPSGNPRLNKAVKVWASDAVTITSGGQSYAIDGATPAWLVTDGSGELSIQSPASAFTTPALYLWGNFMDADEAVVVYPDHDTSAALANADADGLLAARAYDGTPLLPSGFGSAQAGALASMVRNAMGGTASSMAKTRAAAARRAAGPGDPSRYIAFPEATPLLVYQAAVGPTERPLTAGEVPSWTVDISPADVSFTPGTAGLGAGRRRKRHLPPKLRRPDNDPEDLESGLGGFFSSIADFAKNVASDVSTDVEKVASITWDFAEGAAVTIATDAENTYKFVVATVEDAATVVVGALKTVMGSIDRAVQWLSYVFDWRGILDAKDMIKSAVWAMLDNVQKWVTANAAAQTAAMHTTFQSAEASVATALDAVVARIGGTTMQSQQAAGNNPQAFYGMGGAKSYAKTRWLSQKVKDNAGGGSVGGVGNGKRDAAADFAATAQGVLTSMTSALGAAAFPSLGEDVRNLFAGFSQLATDPTAFVTNSLGDVLDVLRDFLTLLLQVADAAAEALVQSLADLVGGLVGVVTQPLDIPFVSSLYSAVTGGSTLTILDLCCLVVAVPTSIVSRALGIPTKAETATTVVEVATLATYALYTIFDAAADVLSSEEYGTGVLGWLSFGTAAVLQGLALGSFWLPTPNPAPMAAYAFWSVQLVPLALSGLDNVTGDAPLGNPLKDEWEGISPFVWFGYAAVMGVWSLILADSDDTNVFSGDEAIAQNFVSLVPYLAKPIGADQPSGSTGKLALGTIDAACDLIAFGLEVAQAAGKRAVSFAAAPAGRQAPRLAGRRAFIASLSPAG